MKVSCFKDFVVDETCILVAGLGISWFYRVWHTYKQWCWKFPSKLIVEVVYTEIDGKKMYLHVHALGPTSWHEL